VMQHYQDAIAICRAMGSPDFFMTFTCNPSWPEITDELIPGQRSEGRLDLTTRVFRIKLRQFLDDFKEKQILRKSLLVSLLNSNTCYLFIIYTLFILILVASFTELYVVELQK